MLAQDLLELLRAVPFQPFRIHASENRIREIRHPDEALVLRTRVILPLGSQGEIPEASEHLALSHIVRLEELAPLAKA
jgi:hypothetical protein